MRVGMDYRPAIGAATGIGRYVSGLAGALGDGCDLRLYGVFLRGNRPALRAPPRNARLVAWRFPARAMNWLGRTGLLPADRLLGGCDLFHHTDYVLVEVARETPELMTIHDLAFLKNPEWHTPRAAGALAEVVSRARDRCAAFVVPSEATASDCRELLGILPERLHVTPLGVDRGFFDLPDAGPGPRYLLAVGTLEPRKNYPRLIRAFSRARVGAELWIAGGAGWLYDEVVAAAAGARGVRLLGRVGEAELRRLLAGAEAVLYPSLLEGFGLPVLEAMAAGKAVLTSDREPLRGLAGDAALLVDPTDEEALAAGVHRLCADAELRDDLARRAVERARRYTWEACAAATRRAYDSVVAGRPCREGNVRAGETAT